MVDVVRLFVEAVEEAELVGLTREEVIAGFRRVVRAGVKAVREEERTLPFGEVVRMSLEARQERRKSTIYDLRSYAGRMALHEGVVYIAPQHSKTGGARLIPLRGAAAHLPAIESGAIAPKNWAKKWRTLRQRAGLYDWQQDALRHTFASYHMRRFANPPQLQAEMGHRDSSLLRTRYVNVRNLTSADARHFWHTSAGKI